MCVHQVIIILEYLNFTSVLPLSVLFLTLFIIPFYLTFSLYFISGAEQYRSDCDIKGACNGTENLLYKHQDSPNSIISRSPLQMRQASPFPLESTNRRVHYVTAAAPNPSDRHRSSGNNISHSHFSSNYFECKSSTFVKNMFTIFDIPNEIFQVEEKPQQMTET